MTRIVRFVIHNWPLKLAAIGLATLLYGGLVLSQTSKDFSGSVPIVAENAPVDVIVLSTLGSVTSVSYVAPPDLGLRIESATFEATVNLAGIDPTGGPVSMTVQVESVDPRIQVLDFTPRAITVTLDRVSSKSVPIRAVLVGPIPSGLDISAPTVDSNTATVSGPQSVIADATEVRAGYRIDASGIDINELVHLVPVDADGAELAQVDVEPADVRVHVAVFSDRRSKSLPVKPNVTGTPAAGFEVVSVDVSPPIVSVEGDANDLAGVDRADTEPISISGASSEVTQIVELLLPDGVQALGAGTVQVTVTLRPVTATRSFEAGLALVGARADRVYALSTGRVIVTIGGSLADLDRLSGSTLVLSLDVTGLDDGTHSVPVSANLQTGLTLVAVSPGSIEVVVSSPEPTPAASTPASLPAASTAP
ncbi:MAG TPA: CdaR family protein [Candidatus Limnocylindria bacterium]|nr:CdaR family protein [Candidatus Limnocylindria bacterium]